MPSANVTCRGCGKSGFHFEIYVDTAGMKKNRMVDSFGEVHSCPEYRALMAKQNGMVPSEGIHMPADVTSQVAPATMEALNQRLIKVETAAGNAVSMVSSNSGAFLELRDEHQLLQLAFNALMKDYIQLDSKWEQKLTAKQVVVLEHWDGTMVDVGKQHRSFVLAVKMLISARLGRQALWIHGEPGSMKTSMVGPLAKAVGVEGVWVVPCSWTMSYSDLMGYQAPDGQFVAKPSYWVYKNGGLLCYDEAALTNPSTFASMNALISNDFVTFPNGETVQKHPDCHIMVADNTVGGGDERYSARQKLDPATRTRFLFLEIDTDWEYVCDILEANGVARSWGMKVKALNNICKKRKIEWQVTSRVALAAIGMFKMGFSEADILDAMLWPNVSVTERAQIESEMK